MARAKTLTNEQLIYVLDYVAKNSNMPARDYVIVLLSFKAGLRAQEIAGLTWRDVTDAAGPLCATQFDVPPAIAKKGGGRTIPMHPAIHAALAAWARISPRTSPHNKIVVGGYKDEMTPNTLQRYLSRLYTAAHMIGVTSHSGRRSFITAAARAANTHGCSLKDVQLLAGHKFLDTTEKYIDVSVRTRDLVNAI